MTFRKGLAFFCGGGTVFGGRSIHRTDTVQVILKVLSALVSAWSSSSSLYTSQNWRLADDCRTYEPFRIGDAGQFHIDHPFIFIQVDIGLGNTEFIDTFNQDLIRLVDGSFGNFRPCR